MNTIRPLRTFALGLVAVLALAACGDDSPTGPGSGSGPGTTLPADVDVSGTWQVVVQASGLAPAEFDLRLDGDVTRPVTLTPGGKKPAPWGETIQL